MPNNDTIKFERRRTRLRLVGALLLQVLIAAVLGLVYGWTRRHDIPFQVLTRDVVAQTDLPYFAGYLSHLGGMLWCAAAAVCLFSYLVARGRVDKPWPGFFLFAGALSALMAADDLFLLHEELFPRELKLHERVVISVYLLLCALLVIRYFRLLPQTHVLLLGLAVACFVVSLSVDRQLLPVAEDNRHLLEDGFKLVGIANWCAYFVHACWSRLTALIVKPAAS